MSSTIRSTKDYTKFDLFQVNRDVQKIRPLVESMKAHGWLDAYPMHCIQNGGGRLLIKGGHHRFAAAQQLGIPVKYVVCDDEATIHELEASTRRWTMQDYLDSYCKMGLTAYTVVRDYSRQTGVPLQLSAALLAGHTSDGPQMKDDFRNGVYRLGDTTIAHDVRKVVMACRDMEIECATNVLFVRALARCFRVEQFCGETFIERVKANKGLMVKQADMEGYMHLIEAVYNRKAHAHNTIPLRFLVEQEMKRRDPARSRKHSQ